ncbi:hypothetical protein GCM10009789_37510 [Kribbella sancticallisti]|uniref:STAS domain-containing protein n=1 Tax=Kribbella sancticallisti TaxID=460087 RepID=A0ABN2DPW2_9ACTN
MSPIQGRSRQLPKTAPSTRICLQVAGDAVTIEVTGVLDAHTAEVVRELLPDACSLSPGVVALDLDGVPHVTADANLLHLVDDAQRLCWASSCTLQVTCTEPEVRRALSAEGL